MLVVQNPYPKHSYSLTIENSKEQSVPPCKKKHEADSQENVYRMC